MEQLEKIQHYKTTTGNSLSAENQLKIQASNRSSHRHQEKFTNRKGNFFIHDASLDASINVLGAPSRMNLSKYFV